MIKVTNNELLSIEHTFHFTLVCTFLNISLMYHDVFSKLTIWYHLILKYFPLQMYLAISTRTMAFFDVEVGGWGDG
jgi:hypothetical protein